MIGDTFTVIWHDTGEWLRASRRYPVLLRYLAFLFIFGVIFPWQFGNSWLDSPAPLAYWSWYAIFLASAATSGSFARERELHTLETLLATRLPDAAILLGKILSGVLYAGLLVLISLLFGQVTLLLAGNEAPSFYNISIAVGGYLTSLMAAFGVGAISALTSMKAATTRQAQTQTSLVIIVLFLPMLLVQFAPGLQDQVILAVESVNADVVVWGIVFALTIVNAILWLIARASFNRSRLVRIV